MRTYRFDLYRTLFEPYRPFSVLRSLTTLITLITLISTLGVGCDEQETSMTPASAVMSGDVVGGEMSGEIAGDETGGAMSGGEVSGGEVSGGEVDGGGASGAGEIAGAEAGDSTTAGTAPAVVCDPLATINEEAAFIERTAEWGFEGVQGTLISAADLDNDGRADLVVRRGGVRADVIGGPEPKQHTWVMMNRSEGRAVRFEDFTSESGFLTTRGQYPVELGRPNWVVIFGDIDNDGDLDAYSGIDLRTPPEVTVSEEVITVDRESSEVLLNDGSGRFTLTYRQDPLRRSAGSDVPSGAAFLDVNRDGWLDLWMSQGGLGAPLQDRLFVNRGQGELTDQTVEYGLATQEWMSAEMLNSGNGHSTAWSAGACDLNADGDPELFVGSYGRAPNHLWLARRSGTGELSYLNHSVASGVAFDRNQEWNGDQFARCFCASNPNADGCADAPPPLISCGQGGWDHDSGRLPFRLGGNTGAIVCEDLDGDGDLDLLTAEIRHWWAGEGSDGSEVLLNNGDETPLFERPGRAALGMEIEHEGPTWDEGHISATVFDYDNDGYQDLFLGATDYPGNEALIFHNETGARGTPSFRRLSAAEGIDHHRSHGVAVADLDGDGDLDLIVGHSRMRCRDDEVTTCYPTQQVRVFENILGQARRSVRLTLKGGESAGGLVNAGAVGARVEVRPLGGTDDHIRVRYVRGGYGHFGQQSEAALTVGLDDACEAEVTVTWPNSALTQEQWRISAGGSYQVSPGALELTRELSEE